jgi:hypothetical protein
MFLFDDLQHGPPTDSCRASAMFLRVDHDAELGEDRDISAVVQGLTIDKCAVAIECNMKHERKVESGAFIVA